MRISRSAVGEPVQLGQHVEHVGIDDDAISRLAIPVHRAAAPLPLAGGATTGGGGCHGRGYYQNNPSRVTSRRRQVVASSSP